MNYVEYMQRAISSADAFKYTAKPNPVVGAILVKGNQIISEGAHEKFGSSHAEINAIEKAKEKIGVTFTSFEEFCRIRQFRSSNAHHGLGNIFVGNARRKVL